MKSLQDISDQGRPARWPRAQGPDCDALGTELKSMFGSLTEGPMPDRMRQLADALEEAFRRGELFDIPRSRPS
jgi:hypothetical protein